MGDLDALLAGIVADPSSALRWLVMADWLDDHGQPERAELVRVHRELLRTCTATRETMTRKQFHTRMMERNQLHARMMELMLAGVQPCLPQRTITPSGGVEMRFSFIPPGSFLMGSPKSETGRSSDEHRHLVTLTRGFWVGQTPVTQAQWVAGMGENPSHFKGDELPVDTVSWDDAHAFCEAMKTLRGIKLRLPTEAEWEYVARGGTTTPFSWGEELNGMQANCSILRGPYLGRTTAVGSYSVVSPHPWAVADVIGNILEWCWDWHGKYPTGEVTDPKGPKAGRWRAVRGGGWNGVRSQCRTAYRSKAEPNPRGGGFGFRLAADLSALA